MRAFQNVCALAAIGVLAISAAADESFVLEDELNVVAERRQKSVEQAVDLRPVVPVPHIGAVGGLMYSAVGWVRDATVDATRKVTITAQAGTLADGVFTSDGSAEMMVQAGLTGEGTVFWSTSGVEAKLYQLKHTVWAGSNVDPTGYLYGYLDFTQCNFDLATPDEICAAVAGEITHPFVVRQDFDRPWQPIEKGVEGSGIATDAELASGVTTATAFSFTGSGTLHYEYKLGDGSLVVKADGVAVEALAATAEWVGRTISFADFDAHEVSFAYTAANGGRAALRNVRWEEADVSARVWRDGARVRVDLREGVRTPKYFNEILPFAYSSTNWIGVAKATAASSVRVTLVPMAGQGADTTQWTESGDPIELYSGTGEGSVKWPKPENGLWKATFDILNDDTGIYSEDAFFDLRKTRNLGFMLMVF